MRTFVVITMLASFMAIQWGGISRSASAQGPAPNRPGAMNPPSGRGFGSPGAPLPPMGRPPQSSSFGTGSRAVAGSQPMGGEVSRYSAVDGSNRAQNIKRRGVQTSDRLRQNAKQSIGPIGMGRF